MFVCVILIVFGLLNFFMVGGKELPDLPLEHYAYYFRSNADKFHLCSSDARCAGLKLKESLVNESCWGYEDDCNQRYSRAECPDSSMGWTSDKAEQLRIFNTQSDFDYISERKKELKKYCKPNTIGEKNSLLECTSYTRFCHGKNIGIDFSNLIGIKEPMKYSGDVLSDGQIFAHGCDYDKKSLLKLGGHKSPLQSWFEELEHFAVVDDMRCDIVIEKPTFLMKLDATVNMYHHFCDFINLFVTLHFNNSFAMDNNVLIWDTFPYRSNFGDTFAAFSKNPIMNLSGMKGKRVCFKDIVFTFLPRMIFGLYYNMPLIEGCSGSGLFKAFNKHVLHKLRIKTDVGEEMSSTLGEKNKMIRITLLSRSTQFRRIINEEELLATVKKKSRNFVVQKVDFKHSTPFKEQLIIIANTDILIGMHGAGLTHSLFLPDWGVLFELYNCDDANCYKDLARLRGVKYMTWEKAEKVHPADEGKHPQLGAHKKFTNYSFDKDEFMRLVMIAVKHVRSKRQIILDGANNQRDEL